MIYDIKIAEEINIYFREESVGSHMGIMCSRQGPRWGIDAYDQRQDNLR